jgi:hypothetical protein
MADLFPNLPKTFTLQHQILCVEREIAMRRRVYPRWVQAARMTKNAADYELACMEAVLQTLKGLQKP